VKEARMPVELNHTIIWSDDPKASAVFMAEILGRPAPQKFMHFEVVPMDNGVSMDFGQGEGKIATQHYAFLVSDAEFDEIFGRVRARGLDYWADPARTKPGEINTFFGGRGVYFRDPTGHLLEIITRPYA
jgi:catechol 2,3-dioxygenase-like lactoylglutathione lyase family enzyme